MLRQTLIVMAVLVALIMASPGQAVVVFEDNFDGPTLDPYWTQEGPLFPESGFVHPGHYQLKSTAAASLEGLSHILGPGNLTAELHLEDFDQAGTTDNQWQFLDFDPGDPAAKGGGLIQMLTIDGTDLFVLSFVQLASAPTTSLSFTKAEVDSLDLRIQWADDPTPGETGTWSAWYNLNDAGWTDMGSFVNACEALEERKEVIFVYPAAGNAPDGPYTQMCLDYYSIVPEPVTMLLLGLGGLAAIRRRR